MVWKIPGIFIFPRESRQKFQNMPQITPFQITLSFLVIRSENTPDFHLTLLAAAEKNSIFFIDSPQTLNLVKNLKFLKKSEIFGFEKFYKNYLFIFYLKNGKKLSKYERKPNREISEIFLRT